MTRFSIVSSSGVSSVVHCNTSLCEEQHSTRARRVRRKRCGFSMGDTDGAQHKRCGNRPCEEMDDKIIEELRAFIGQRYASFMTSTLTFRHLKQHLSDTLGIPYETLGLPDGRYGETLDDEVDRIAVRCDGGARDVACVATPGYVPPKPFIRVHHVFGYGALVVAAIVMFRKRPRRRAVDKNK